MKKSVIKACILAAVIAAVVSGYMFVSGTAAPAEEEFVPPAESSTDSGGYVVKSYNGKVALFTDSFNVTPAVETDIDVSVLRAHDRELLENGIRLGTYEDVLKMFEDFGP